MLHRRLALGADASAPVQLASRLRLRTDRSRLWSQSVRLQLVSPHLQCTNAYPVSVRIIRARIMAPSRVSVHYGCPSVLSLRATLIEVRVLARCRLFAQLFSLFARKQTLSLSAIGLSTISGGQLRQSSFATATSARPINSQRLQQARATRRRRSCDR